MIEESNFYKLYNKVTYRNQLKGLKKEKLVDILDSILNLADELQEKWTIN